MQEKIWVLEEHIVGNETEPSARLFSSKEAALAVLAREEAEAKAENEELGFEHEAWFQNPGFEYEGGLWWKDEDGSWRALTEQALEA